MRTLAKHVDLVAGARATTDRVYLDTFDGRLHRSGLTLWRDLRRGSDGLLRLTLGAPERELPPVAAALPQPDRILTADLPAGPIRDRLSAVIDERALIAQVRVRTSLQPAAVCNSDGKTVVRLVVEEPSVAIRGRGHQALSRRVRITPVLGYDRDFTRLTHLVNDNVRLAPATSSIFEEAMNAAGRPVDGVSSDVDVPLEQTMPAGSATLLICRRLAEIVDANLPGTLADIDTEFLHDLRVAVRRTRSVLKEMKGVLPPEGADQARVDLRWIQQITGPTRDLDVQLHEWPAVAATVSLAMAPDLPPVHDLLAAHRAAAFAAMRRQLRGKRYTAAWAAWRTVLCGEPHGPNAALPVGRLAGGRILNVYRGMVKMGSAIEDTSPPEALHELRKRGKELRYLLELFGRMWPADTVKPLVSTLKSLQDVLGRFQDDQIQASHLRGLGPELAARSGGTDALIALGGVIDSLALDQREARQAFAVRFEPFAAARTRQLVHTTFAPST